MYFTDDMIVEVVPLVVREYTREGMDVYNLNLADAFEDAAREYAKPGTELYDAWFYNDFRKYIPSAYEEKYLDFEKYPLKYQRKK